MLCAPLYIHAEYIEETRGAHTIFLYLRISCVLFSWHNFVSTMPALSCKGETRCDILFRLLALFGVTEMCVCTIIRSCLSSWTCCGKYFYNQPYELHMSAVSSSRYNRKWVHNPYTYNSPIASLLRSIVTYPIKIRYILLCTHTHVHDKRSYSFGWRILSFVKSVYIPYIYIILTVYTLWSLYSINQS